MKKIFMIFLCLIIMVSLVGCKKRIYSDEDKLMYNEYFKKLDETKEFKELQCSLSFHLDEIEYVYYYRVRYEDNGSIVVKTWVDPLQNCYVYTYYNDTLLIQEFTYILTSKAELLNEQETYITKEQFEDTFVDLALTKYNFDLKDTKYYRTKSLGMHSTTWDHFFIFDKNYTYEYEIVGKKVRINKCKIEFTSGEKETGTNIDGFKLTGVENGIKYLIGVYLDKEIK